MAARVPMLCSVSKPTGTDVCHNGTGAKFPNLEVPVIDTLLNLLFRCAHRRLTRPVAPITKAGQPHSQSYVVCLDCGKQFEYDLSEMRIGKAIDHSNDASVVPKDMPLPPTTKVKYALLAAVPAAVLLGAVLKAKKKAPKAEQGQTDRDPRYESDSGKDGSGAV
jgi:hypothetical protein